LFAADQSIELAVAGESYVEHGVNVERKEIRVFELFCRRIGAGIGGGNDLLCSDGLSVAGDISEVEVIFSMNFPDLRS
jgi:hypothetical protein